jgi:hypothetical protein
MDFLLKGAGFDTVIARQDLGAAEMRRALRDFSDQVRGADIVVIYYAGHGLEVNGTNYLIPTDAVLERDLDVEDEAIPLDRVTQIVEPAKRLRLVILDACRNNPFLQTMQRTMASRSIGRGLAKVDVLASDTLIAFAAKAGSIASDGSGSNSPYTSALLRHLATPGLDLRLALGRVRDDVLTSTGGRQEPYIYGSLGGTEVALVPGVEPPPVKRPATRQLSKFFDNNDLARVKRMASAKSIPLPERIEVLEPTDAVPDTLRRFIGIWISETGTEATGRQYALLLTDVSPSGESVGGHCVGPPTAKTTFRTPSACHADFGQISGDMLVIKRPRLDTTIRMDRGGSVLLTETWTNGLLVRVHLKPVWTLSQAERARKRPE